MAIVLGRNQYGKAECRVVRVYRDGDRHEIRDLNVSTSLRGDFTAAHVGGDQADVLPTDTQKNTAFAFAKSKGVGAIEEYAQALAEHFVDRVPKVTGARVEVEEYAWRRIDVDGRGHDHAFVRSGEAVRNTVVNVEGTTADRRTWVVSGVSDLVIAKTTGSEFKGFLQDEYTTLAETDDRVLATSLVARWRYADTNVDWDATHAAVVRDLLAVFAERHSRALQQSLYDMGEAVLERHPEIAEIRFSAPNKHHFLVDLAPFGQENPGEVFIAADRPYGLIEATVLRDDAPAPGSAWHSTPGFC
ncbi:factor-independent urate hydroxylase [Solicola gregarius]|uniref:Uricase n=1 Tax=Solicola gregarius TaxID=2908642 RepID=A0AA46TI27_9ACTN|nr:urate oxidase [Solicola gregarius]UYM05540.1 urate oxidase [Solicola gregarius]